MFYKMSLQDAVSWTVMVLAYTKQGFTEEAFVLFWKMREIDCTPNELAFANVLPAVGNLGSLKLEGCYTLYNLWIPKLCCTRDYS